METSNEINIARVEKGKVVFITAMVVILPLFLLGLQMWLHLPVNLKTLGWFLFFELLFVLYVIVLWQWRSWRLTLEARGLKLRTMLWTVELDWDEVTAVRLADGWEGTKIKLRGRGGAMTFNSLEGEDRIMKCIHEQADAAMILDYKRGVFLAPPKDGPGGKQETRLMMMRYLHRAAMASGITTFILMIGGIALLIVATIGLWNGKLSCHSVCVGFLLGPGMSFFSITRWKEGNVARKEWRRLVAGEPMRERQASSRD
jgi:hypothetical protein